MQIQIKQDDTSYSLCTVYTPSEKDYMAQLEHDFDVMG